MFHLPKFKPLKSGKPQRIAVLTSGGDAPGMNAAIRSVVRTALAHGAEAMGIQRGYAGMVEGLIHPMSASSVANIIQRGGTILKTSRCPEFHKKSGRNAAFAHLKAQNIDGIVVIGGDGSFRGGALLNAETGIPVIGIPGTIDNDIPGTDDTIGFDSAVNTGIQSIDRIRDTASSHDRVFLVEVMGRHSGMIALYTGIGGGAETIIVPEVKVSVDSICKTIERGMRRGKTSSIIVVAEGCHFGGAVPLAKELEKKGYPARCAILGHTQRGGSPTANDRMLASILGAVGVRALMAGVQEGMVGVQGKAVTVQSFSNLKQKAVGLPSDLLALAQDLAI